VLLLQVVCDSPLHVAADKAGVLRRMPVKSKLAVVMRCMGFSIVVSSHGHKSFLNLLFNKMRDE